MKNNVKIFGCGGAGINTVKNYRAKESTLFDTSISAETSYSFVDTSYANVSKEDETLFYRFPDANVGSGGLRSENFEAIRSGMKDFLSEHPAEDINIVVFSSSGGSGSTIGSVLVQELLKDTSDKLLVVVTYIDNTSELRTRNSYNTIRTLEKIAESTNKPVVIFPIVATSRNQADSQAMDALYYLNVLFSNTHRELDNADVYNFINFNRVTSYPARLAALDIAIDQRSTAEVGNTEVIDMLKDSRPVSAAMLHSDVSYSDLYKGLFMTGYNCEGFIEKPDTSIIYTVSIDEIRLIAEMLDENMKSFNDANGATMDTIRKTTKAKNIAEGQQEGDFFL